ncbi:MAG: T9SS type A sorting domain-containing protein [Candidatus Marinimicrobia bacterium]|nr:T9SS type A sorting domain-containing protein [Candidatus Neomarinimicrobiota bacterium]
MKNTHIIRLFLNLMIIFFMGFSLGVARDSDSKTLHRPSTLEDELFEGNNINNYIGNDGHLVSHRATGDSGLEWPAGSGNTAIFSAGIWVAGMVDGEIRTAAAEFSSEWTPGSIPYDTQTKQPIGDLAPNTPLHQIYFIQQGNSSDLSSPQFSREYATWPASDGAPARDGENYTDLNHNGMIDPGEPYEDFNRDGTYNPPDGQMITGEDPPLFQGDEMLWWIMNDWSAETHHNLWSTPPLGMEAQVTVYNRTGDPFYENVQFYQVKLVNKGGEQLDSVYFSFWNDADVGDATDDFVGCDTTLDLGYVYNGHPYDRDYGITPPSVGYTFLRGPLVSSPGDSILYQNAVHPGVRALGMTAHVKLTNGFPHFHDPEEAMETYWVMQGRYSYSGEAYHEYLDPSRPVTTFHYPGDPVTRSGWTEYDDSDPDDRRNLTSTGPFTMPPWDDVNGNGQADFGEPGVQIIESALIVTDGANNLDAITSLKYVTGKVRSDFAQDFESPYLESPAVNVSANDQEIVLNWYEDAEAYEATNQYGYAFEGYNVYQGQSAAGPWTRLHTYDMINEVGHIVEQIMDANGFVGTKLVQFGDDTGLTHLISITEDALNEDAPLTNNKLYHFAVSAYAYNEEKIPKSLESSKRVFSIRPHETYNMAGVRDTLEVEQVGISDVDVTVDVRDPGQLTGLNYKLGFDYDSTQAKARWYVTRRSVSFQDTALKSDWHGLDWFPSQYYRGADLYLDGFELSIANMSFSRPRVNATWQQTVNLEGTTIDSLTLKAVSPGAVDSLFYDLMGNQIVHIDTLVGHDYYYDYYRIEERSDGTYYILYHYKIHDVYIQAFASNFGAIGGDRIADIPGVGGGSEDVEFLQSDIEIRFTESGQKATRYLRRANDTLITIPFEVWDIERDIQLCVGIRDNNKTGNIQDTSLVDWENTLDLDWVIVFDRDYESYADSLQPFYDNPYSGWAWQFNDESRFSIGDLLILQFVNPIDPAVDAFHWTTDVSGLSYDEEALDKIQVFPNPYFGYHTDQTTASGPYVTFSNLPEGECAIRIYSLGGHLVKRIDHDSGSYENWNLLNEHNHRVASGIYIVHIEVPDLGNRILKLAILQPE